MPAIAALKRRVRTTLLNRLLPQPFVSRHIEYTVISSLDDDTASPSPRLIDLALESIALARTVDLSSITARMLNSTPFSEIWPGEHYRLLAGMVKVLQPKLIVE